MPFLNVAGFGVDLNTTVADLMSVAALSGPIISGVIGMVSGLAQMVGGVRPVLRSFGIYADNSVRRGSGAGLSAGTSASNVSTSGIVGNSSSDDVVNKTMTDAD